MTSMTALFTVSLRQALPPRRSILFVIAELAPAAIYLLATSSRTESSAFQGVVEIGGGTYLALVIPVVAITTAAGVLGNERRDMTLSFIALRPMPRWGIAGVKLLAAATGAIAINAVGALGLGIAHTVRYGGGQLIVALLVAGAVATIAYVAVYVPLGFLTDRAVIIGMVYLFIVENGVIFAVSGLALLSPWRLGTAVFVALEEDARAFFADALGSLSATRALLAVLVYVVAGWAVTTFLLNRRDLA